MMTFTAFALLSCLAVCVVCSTASLHAQQFDLSPGKKVVISDSVFRRGSAVIEPQSLGEFDKLARYIQARPQLQFEIRGHASNEGSPDRNLRLSQDRADAAKAYLVRVYGVPADRIRTKGVGDTQPLVANADEIARAKNRRVEFIGISSITERTLTTDNNTALEPDGKLTVVQNRVQTRAPWESDWQVAGVGTPIYEYHRITTAAGARAEITFKDGVKMQVGENASMIVYSPQKNRPQDKPQETVELIRGDVFLKFKKQTDTDQVSIKTAGERVTLNNGTAKIGIDSASRRVALSVLEGSARLKGDSSDSEIPENFGMQLGGSGSTKQLRRIPQAPKLMEPDPKLLALVPVSSPITFKWMNTSFRTRLEVSETDDFLNPVFKTTTGGDSALVDLKPGKYFFRLASVDSVGLESKNLLHNFNIQLLDNGKGFKVVPYLLFLFGVLFAWASMLFNTPFHSRSLVSWAIEGNHLSFHFANSAPEEYTFRTFTINHQILIKTLRSAATMCLLAGLLMLLR